MRRAHSSLLLAVLLLAGSRSVEAAAAPSAESFPPPAEAVRRSLTRGIDFLVRSQNPDGSWGSPVTRRSFEIYAPSPGSHHAFRGAVTALCVLALVESEVEQGSARAALDRGAAWLVDHLGRVRRATPDAIYNMWAHAYGLQALAALAGRERDAARKGKLLAAAQEQIDRLVRCESVDGGWGYYDFEVGAQKPASTSTSFSTATVLIALHAAERNGLRVPRKIVERALARLVDMRTPEGGYLYSFDHRYHPIWLPNRTKGGLGRIQVCNAALRLFGGPISEDDLRTGLEALFRYHHFIDFGRKRPWPHEAWYMNSGYYFFYGHYYAGLAIELLPRGERWPFQAKLATVICALQEPDGSWWDYPLYSYHKPYGTAFAILALRRAGLHE